MPFLKYFILLFLLSMGLRGFSQSSLANQISESGSGIQNQQPTIQYKLQVDLHDLSGFDVEMQLNHVPDTFQVAMFAHPIYDDRFWRFIEDFKVQTPNNYGSIIRLDSSLWRVTTYEGKAILHYRIHLPQRNGNRPAWRPFLSRSGGLVGGAQSFMFVVGATKGPSKVILQLPEGWEVRTGLTPGPKLNSYIASSSADLVDAPILIGNLKNWDFEVGSVLHHVVYWPDSSVLHIDTATLIASIKKIVQQAYALFGALPYHEYFFLLQDSAFGVLEHINSITLGISPEAMSLNEKDFLSTVAHEYFHAWNLMRIRPAEYGDINDKPWPPARGLWWGEGVTMFYADLLLRRAHLPVDDSSRIVHLESLMTEYFDNPGNAKVPVEVASMALRVQPGIMGDYYASTHLQGELLGSLLDLVIRNKTGGQRSLDDVMRKMLIRFGGSKGYTSRDIEELCKETCTCQIDSFFENYVWGDKEIDFDSYLKLIGLHPVLTWKEALNDKAKLKPDLHVSSWQEPGKTEIRLMILDPLNCWGRAGLHTGDHLIKFNGQSVSSLQEFRSRLGKLEIGDTVSMEVLRSSGIYQATIKVTGWKTASVRINEIPEATSDERRLREQWLEGR